jgi:mRNA-degrading endonuclease RelE of RelBE toxin-antitoxin system
MNSIVELSKTAERQLHKIPAQERLGILNELSALSSNPLPPFPKCKKLVGIKPATYRLRIGNYRAIYRIYQNKIAILVVIDRKELERETKKLV